MPPTSPMVQRGVANIEALGLRRTLFLAALLAAQLRRIPVAPTRRTTLLILDALRDLGLIQVPWPADRWQIRPDAEVTPIEDLQWAFAWATHERRHLLPVLEDQLSDMAQDAELAAQKRELWDELALWETEQFLEQQLLKHHFDPGWARDVGFVFESEPRGLPIARWRYCCWAAVRQGASVAMRQGVPASATVREAIFQELKKRLRYIASSPPHQGMFKPYHSAPESAVAKLFVDWVVPMEWVYWTSERECHL
jgi:hypothetical protein